MRHRVFLGRALVIALLATHAVAQDWTVLPQHWLPPVATVADLPATGNQLGDVREVIDGPVLYCWDGASWIACGGSGGGSGAVESVFGRAGVVVALPGDYSCDQVTGGVSDARTAESAPRLSVDGALVVGDGVASTFTQTFDLAGDPDPTLTVSAGAFELDGVIRGPRSCVGPNCALPECDASSPVTVCDEEPTIAFIETGTVDTQWRMGGDSHRFVLQDAVTNPVDSSPPTVFPAVHNGRFCRGTANVCDEGFCSPSCPCNLGQGDCDTDADCLGDLVCGTDNGAASGCGATVDVCVEG